MLGKSNETCETCNRENQERKSDEDETEEEYQLDCYHEENPKQGKEETIDEPNVQEEKNEDELQLHLIEAEEENEDASQLQAVEAEEENDVLQPQLAEEEPTLRRSNRECIPKKQCPCCSVVHSSYKKKIPSSFQEAINGPDAEKWKTADDKELKALQMQDTWEIVRRPPEARVIGWVY
ncbi:uncharacterized protein LOC120351140 [Nilaparvata lugens]|uniref:uncharacterized protein LOC120351140 n=1 Tax=Nilaparvata lugens TaxID=108931 RepID=UPI00193D9EB4|nr:uncharacterized protein LOC120351140 [Nilaparvata lugens]